MKKKPVLVVALLFRRKGAIGGMAQRFAKLADFMAKRGNPVQLFSTKSVIEHLALDATRAIKLNDSKPVFSVLNLFVLFWVVLRVLFGSYSRVHLAGGGGKFAGIVFAAARLSRTPVSCTFGARTLDMASYGREKDKAAWIKLLNAVDKIDVLNPGHTLQRWQAKISVSPCSFLANAIEPAEPPKTKDPLVIFCGSLERNKNPMLALEIFDRVCNLAGRKLGEKLELIFFGKGQKEQELREAIAKLNLNSNREAAKIEDFALYFQKLRRASVFLSLQEHDNYPSQSLMEAMILGCKTLCTADGDTKLMFGNTVNNRVVDSRNPDDFAVDLLELLQDEGFCEANANHINLNHNIERFAEYFSDFCGIRNEANS